METPHTHTPSSWERKPSGRLRAHSPPAKSNPPPMPHARTRAPLPLGGRCPDAQTSRGAAWAAPLPRASSLSAPCCHRCHCGQEGRPGRQGKGPPVQGSRAGSVGGSALRRPLPSVPRHHRRATNSGPAPNSADAMCNELAASAVHQLLHARLARCACKPLLIDARLHGSRALHPLPTPCPASAAVAPVGDVRLLLYRHHGDRRIDARGQRDLDLQTQAAMGGRCTGFRDVWRGPPARIVQNASDACAMRPGRWWRGWGGVAGFWEQAQARAWAALCR